MVAVGGDPFSNYHFRIFLWRRYQWECNDALRSANQIVIAKANVVTWCCKMGCICIYIYTYIFIHTQFLVGSSSWKTILCTILKNSISFQYIDTCFDKCCAYIWKHKRSSSLISKAMWNYRVFCLLIDVWPSVPAVCCLHPGTSLKQGISCGGCGKGDVVDGGPDFWTINRMYMVPFLAKSWVSGLGPSI